MELRDLIGEHLLDAVDFSNEQVKTWGDEFEACQIMRFRLDGKVYTAIEDPSDGYRSCMRELTFGDLPMANTFSPVRVLARHRAENAHGNTDDILELLDVVTGRTIVEVGTEDTDDYYPSFVASFHPEAMASNAMKETK